MYTFELEALNKANRYRKRHIYDETLHDFSSNDYLGLAHQQKLFQDAFTQVAQYETHAPKASLLVNGYHPIHATFEAFLTQQTGFESALVCGSGFLANFSLIEALPRKKDLLILDEEYHASGMVAAKLVDAKVLLFRHNDANHLESLIQSHTYHRVIIAVEGIYSMSGDILNPEIFTVADTYNALLIVDEAHSVGVVGPRLLGVFDLYNISPKPNYIKMGTLGKALGSYGAYILCSEHILTFLCNRAKAVIYTTAPSLFDIALGYQGFLYILNHTHELHEAISKRQKIVKEVLGCPMEGLICSYRVPQNALVMEMQHYLIEKGFLVGAIRPPTVKEAMLRLIPRLACTQEELFAVCQLIKEYTK